MSSTVHPLVRKIAVRIDPTDPREWYGEARGVLKIIADFLEEKKEEEEYVGIPRNLTPAEMLREVAAHRAKKVQEAYMHKDNVGGNIARAEYDPEEKP